ncbi:MAG: ribosome silencing factor [Alphaproteobacteria bacterium]|jgi:ribosome-associated protein
MIVAMLEDDKAEDLSIVNLIGKTAIADYMIIASGRSQRHVGSIADHMTERLKEAGVARVGIEGRQRADWVLLDVGDVIVHLFRPEVRDFYNLEKMWAVPLPEQATH